MPPAEYLAFNSMALAHYLPLGGILQIPTIFEEYDMQTMGTCMDFVARATTLGVLRTQLISIKKLQYPQIW